MEEYSFSSIIPIAYGPEVVNANEDFTVEVLMAAYDKDKQPEVIYDGKSIQDVRNGKGYIKLKGSGSSMELSGTVSIRNKSGIKKTLPWKKSVAVMKPSGSIEMPEFNILYRGYDNKVNATASGYASTVLTPTGASVTKSGDGYIVRPSGGRTATLTVSGRNSDGKSVQLKRITYRVADLPDPTMYWGSARNGSKGARSSGAIQSKYGDDIPLKASFEVLEWKCFAANMKGAPPSGKGNLLTQKAKDLIKAAPAGTAISFTARIKDPAGRVRNIAGSWTL